MDDKTKKVFETLALGAIKKVLMLQAAGLVSHGLLSSNNTEVFVSLGMAAIGAGWSFWNDYGKAIFLSQLEVLKAKSLAQAQAMRQGGVAPVTTAQIANQSPTLTPAEVAKTVDTLPPAIQANVIKVAVAVLLLAGLAFPGDAMAQAKLVKPTGNIAADFAAATGGQNTAPGQSGPIIKPHELMQRIVALAAPDLIYAVALATKANTNASNVRVGCLKAIQALNAQVAGTGLTDPDGKALTEPDVPHIFTDLERAAEGIDALSPTGPLFTSCAGAAALAGMNVLAFINAMVAGTAAAAIVVPK